MTNGDNAECLIFMSFCESPMWCSYIQLKLEPILLSFLNLTMERLLNESDSSMRFRMKMHEYASKHQALVEETYARYKINNDEYQRQRRHEKWNNQKLKCDH